MRRSLLLVTVAVMCATTLSPTGAAADATYHSAHIVLLPDAGTQGGSGFVENAHANGPNVYAHEQYQLRDAAPGTSYQVALHVYVGDPGCGVAALDLPTAVLVTNAAGNAAGYAVFTPADAAGLPKGVPHGIVWTMSAGPGAGYTSSCETVVLD
jgi:hypothetical protein